MFWKKVPPNVLNNKDIKTAFLYLNFFGTKGESLKALFTVIAHLEFHIHGIAIILQAVFV